jgi:hypothetical protein
VTSVSLSLVRSRRTISGVGTSRLLHFRLCDLHAAAASEQGRSREAARLESAKRADELDAEGDLAGVAVSLRIIDATGQLAITTFWAGVLDGCLGVGSRLSSNSSNIIAGRRF